MFRGRVRDSIQRTNPIRPHRWCRRRARSPTPDPLRVRWRRWHARRGAGQPRGRSRRAAGRVL